MKNNPSAMARPWNYLLLGTGVLLVFFLVFDTYIVLPVWLSWLGKWHPLLLHFPIVLILLLVLAAMFKRKVKLAYLGYVALITVVTALSGFFLGKENVVKGELLSWHQNMGGALAILMALWYALQKQLPNAIHIRRVLQLSALVLVGFTGHYGGMLTHGPDFLDFPKDAQAAQLPEDPMVYAHIVRPILEQNCIPCHNTNKQKGELLMTDIGAMMRGGEHGPIIVKGRPQESEMIKRLELPKEDELHMPPEGKTPLTDHEIGILQEWIAMGASDTLLYSRLPEAAPLKGLIAEVLDGDEKRTWATLPQVADSTLMRLSSDYVSINRMANSLHALSVTVFPAPEYEKERILQLADVAPNIVRLDVSGLPIGSEEMAVIGRCSPLEWLEVDGTPISDGDFKAFGTLKELSLLKVYDTQLGDGALSVLATLPKLKKVFLWNTNMTEKAITGFGAKYPHIRVSAGIDDDDLRRFVVKDSIDTLGAP